MEVLQVSHRGMSQRTFLITLAVLAQLTGDPHPGVAAAYQDHHPRLLFTRAELPALYQKVRDGGPDDTAYAFIRHLATDVYPGETLVELLDPSYGIQLCPNLGVAAFLESPEDNTAKQIGRRIVMEVADLFNPDNDEFFTSIRLEILVFGYDMFFEDAPEVERSLIVDEIATYVDTIMTSRRYERRLYRPFLSNVSTMIAASLGLAAIALAGEVPAARTEALLDRADLYVDTWMQYQVDPDGSYKEGAMYAGWSLRHLAPYFWARKRYDGYDYAERQPIRRLEQWIAFALLPEAGAKVNNINQTAYLNRPLSRFNTYFEWAQTAWSSRLSAWLWRRLVGPPYGFDAGEQADKVATVLWHRDLTPQPPGEVLPHNVLWKDRGLYYFRTGWPTGESSDDVVFSFLSGKFHGGHSQEDQNSFTLYGYGCKFAVDNGFEKTAALSDAHNMIFIDGKGQHNSGSSVGTDGNMREHLLSSFADYLFGDATQAYTTYSEFNRPGVPFPEDDWSYGYKNANPVNFAYRRWIVVHDPDTPPYFVLIDDIEKDDGEHTYEWRMHTADTNDIDSQANPIQIGNGDGVMDVHVLNPLASARTVRVEPYDNMNVDPNTNVIVVSQVHSSPNFSLLLVPRGSAAAPPVVTPETAPWGLAAHVTWPGGEDLVLINRSGGEVTWSVGGAGAVAENRTAATDTIKTDGELVVLRLSDNDPRRWIITNATYFDLGPRRIASIDDGPASLALAGDALYVSHRTASVTVYGPEVTRVYAGGLPVSFRKNDDIITRRPFDSRIPDPGIGLHVFPNPFNPETRILVSVDVVSWIEVDVYDVAGRRVKQLWRGDVYPGSITIIWNGVRSGGARAAAGVYFIRATGPQSAATARAVLIK